MLLHVLCCPENKESQVPDPRDGVTNGNIEEALASLKVLIIFYIFMLYDIFPRGTYFNFIIIFL